MYKWIVLMCIGVCVLMWQQRVILRELAAIREQVESDGGKCGKCGRGRHE